MGPAPVGVGDLVRLGIANPCTAFDKWRLIPMAESGAFDARIMEFVRTFF